MWGIVKFVIHAFALRYFSGMRTSVYCCSLFFRI